jgi:membrane associated rhomboid family serine protease
VIVPGDFQSFTSKPFFKISWIFVFLNLTVFAVISFVSQEWPAKNIADKMQENAFKKSIYEMYIQTLDPIEIRANETVDAIFYKAIKDEKFWNRIEIFPFVGDQVEIANVKVVFKEFYKSYRQSPQFLYGLGGFEASPWSWLTYQFVHASFLHLFGNLVIIFLVMSYLERTVSSGWLTSIYLLSGFLGGIFFLVIDRSGSMSVVGASASASGLLGFLLIIHGGKLMPWFYMLIPIREGYGKIYLPVFFILPIFLMSDFITLWWEPTGVATNVAVSAHVGGALMGMLLGGVYLLIRSKTASHRIFSDNNGFHELS